MNRKFLFDVGCGAFIELTSRAIGGPPLFWVCSLSSGVIEKIKQGRDNRVIYREYYNENISKKTVNLCYPKIGRDTPINS
ncbi:MAG: hypothetical protein KAK00_07620 [Nanoarchaeota archaeon]|nr:hypothetical protein [Nanoarchaeota archaeon]